MFDMLKVMMSINNPAMGQPTESKRTLGEIQRIVYSQERRIATTARLVDSMAIRPLLERAMMNRQQFTSLRQFFKIAGSIAEKVDNPNKMLGREDILGNFDYIANTGTVPPDPARFAEVWTNILQSATQLPPLTDPMASLDGKILDVRKVFDEAVRVLGVDDIEKFYVEVQPQEFIDSEVQAGNMVPADGLDPLAAARGAANAA